MRAIFEENLHRYDKIFILDTIPGYQKDEQRIESAKRGIALTEYIANAYIKNGFETITVPVFEGTKEESVRKRAEFILENIL